MFTFKIFWNNYTHLKLYITKIILFIAFLHLFLTTFIYLVLAALGLHSCRSLVVTSRGYSSLWWFLWLLSMGSRAHGLQ